MQLSKFTDYALRILMHLASSPEHVLTTRQIAELHDAKYNHLAKVSQWLVREGYASAGRGRGGGLRLAKDPAVVNIGRLVRDLEGSSGLVECFSQEGRRCLLTPVCGLKGALWSAQEAFFQSLENHTLADLTPAIAPVPELLKGKT